MTEQLPHIIRDGYTRPGYIAPMAGFHGAQHFRFRPMLPLVRQQYLLEISEAKDRGDGAKIVRIGQEVLLRQVVDLEMIDDTGKAIPIIRDGQKQAGAERLLLQTEPNLLTRIQNICLGLSRSDEIPVEAAPDRPGGPIVDEEALRRRMEDSLDAPDGPLAEETELQETDAGN